MYASLLARVCRIENRSWDGFRSSGQTPVNKTWVYSCYASLQVAF